MISFRKPRKQTTKRKRSYKQHHAQETLNGIYIKWLVAEKKKRLLEIAKNGGKRPTRKTADIEERRLANALHGYTHIYTGCYDFSFDTQIRALRPEWFGPSIVNRASERKKKLLEMARSGRRRPNQRSSNLEEIRLLHALDGYASAKSDTYDASFAKEIRTLRPDWFDPHRQIRAEDDKKRIIAIARGGEDKPNKKSDDPVERRFGQAIQRHKNKNSVFYQELLLIRPDWFNPTAASIVAENKRRLLQMAKDGARRPSSRSKCSEERRLESALRRYTGEKNNSYDPTFCKEIRNLRPEWSDPNRHDRVIENKRILLEKAKKGKRRPRAKSPLLSEARIARALNGFINKSNVMFDSTFNDEIRRVAPHWFYRRTPREEDIFSSNCNIERL